jgi:gliding motility associated protien GldN
MRQLFIFWAFLSFGLVFAQPPGTTLEPAPLDRPYEIITNQNKRMVPYPFMRETDVMWGKRVWREVDLREKMNQPFFYPLQPTNGRKSFIQIVIDGLTTQSDLYTAYDQNSDDFRVSISSTEVANMGSYRDTIQITRPTPPYDMVDTIIDEKFRTENVKKFWIKEDWIFEKQMSVMIPRIMGISPLMQVFDRNTGEFRSNRPMYWIYFPKFREVFAVNEMYNTQSHTQRLTYDDVFEKRLFSSKIWKVDNVFDRRIEEYMKGLDALHEGEKVRNQLFFFEHDLWEQ